MTAQPGNRPIPTGRDIATIGYQAATFDDVIATRFGAGIEVLIDVRAAPVSKRPEFNKAAIAEAVIGAGMDYRHLGHLGSPAAARDAARDGQPRLFEHLFEKHLDSISAQRALDQVAALARDRPVCLMCLERDPNHCHRRLVAARLAERTGLGIRHLYVTRDPGPLFAGR